MHRFHKLHVYKLFPLHHVVVADGKASAQQAKHEERLAPGLEGDVVLDGIRNQILGLRVGLRDDEAEQHRSVRGLVDAPVEPRSDRQLGERDGDAADRDRLLNAECDGKTLQSQCPVPLDALEVVDDRNSQSRDAVQHGQDHVGRRKLAEQRLAGQPGQCDVTASQRVVPGPSPLFQLQWLCGINVAHPGPQQGQPEQGRRLVPLQRIQQIGHAKTTREQDEDLGHHLPLADPARGNRAVRLVDGVNLPVLPVVDRLREPRQQRP
mmetsp:Transcript_3661/g.10517  ORF Transcript_3661/g.10517 Transcript_3661/m.10517 type:complete len:265 (+) Transcript_3661:2259-3053(+)